MMDVDTPSITVTANEEVWRAVRRALQRAPEANPFYQALVLEIESALDSRTDEYLRRYEGGTW